MRATWKPEDELFLRNNYSSKGAIYCAKALDKALEKTKGKVKRMKLIRATNRITKKQKDFVLSNYEVLSINKICEICHLNSHQVYRLISRSGIRKARWSNFSSGDEKLLRDAYTTMSNVAIGELLNRTHESIHAKLALMKLTRTPEQRLAIRRKYAAHTFYTKGSLPHNTKSDGEITTRTSKNGRKFQFKRLSLSEWKPLQIFNWELIYGTIPKGMVLRCLTNDTLDCHTDNWELVDRSSHLAKNSGQVTLEDKYITMILTLINKDFRPFVEKMPELIELKRNQLKLRRTINELN